MHSATLKGGGTSGDTRPCCQRGRRPGDGLALLAARGQLLISTAHPQVHRLRLKTCDGASSSLVGVRLHGRQPLPAALARLQRGDLKRPLVRILHGNQGVVVCSHRSAAQLRNGLGLGSCCLAGRRSTSIATRGLGLLVGRFVSACGCSEEDQCEETRGEHEGTARHAPATLTLTLATCLNCLRTLRILHNGGHTQRSLRRCGARFPTRQGIDRPQRRLLRSCGARAELMRRRGEGGWVVRPPAFAPSNPTPAL